VTDPAEFLRGDPAAQILIHREVIQLPVPSVDKIPGIGSPSDQVGTEIPGKGTGDRETLSAVVIVQAEGNPDALFLPETDRIPAVGGVIERPESHGRGGGTGSE